MTEPEFIHNIKEHYQKSPKQIWFTILVIFTFITVCFLHAFFIPTDYENPFYPYQLRTGTQVMAERWPHPDTNDPNFLNELTSNKLNPKNLIWWPLHIKK